MRTILYIVGLFVGSQIIGAWVAASSGYAFGSKDFGDFLSGWSVVWVLASLVFVAHKISSKD